MPRHTDNTGKKAVTYEATLPDGRVVRKKSFNVDQPKAVLGCYQMNGVWQYSGIAAAPENWGVQIFVEATRV
jgi:hypothetical protein